MLNTDRLLAEIFRAFAAALCKAAVEVAGKNGKRILNSLMGRSDNEADDGLENNHERLQELAEKLSSKRDEILTQTKTKLVTHAYEDWISRVRKLEEEVRELEIKYTRQSRQGSSESSTILSKSMEKKCKELHLWLEKEPTIRIPAEKLPERVLFMPKPKPEDNRFLDPIVGNILDKLRDETVKTIGLCGELKMGKTTIMQRLNNNEVTARMFDIVIWVTVSEDINFEKLQRKIADRLKLDLQGITNEFEIYNQIRQRLESKRCLLLFDEVSGSFDSSLVPQYEGSKVVLTARTRSDCREMNVYPVISVDKMSDAVAWEFFKDKVGQYVNLPLVKPIAELVVVECQGVPSVIDKVASKFRRWDSYEQWKDGYEKLQRWSGANIHDIDRLLC